MVVRLETKDPMLRRKDNARNFLDIGDVVGCTYVTADLDVVIVPLQQSLLIEVQCLLCTVRCDIGWESDLQATPRFASFRSEERRVGKECGCRGAAQECKEDTGDVGDVLHQI